MDHLVYDSLNERVLKRFPDLRQPCYAELMILSGLIRKR